MGYNPDEPGVLQAWDTKPESKDSETKHELCMAAHAAEGNNDTRVAGTGCEPQAIGQDGNQPSAKHGDDPIFPQQ